MSFGSPPENEEQRVHARIVASTNIDVVIASGTVPATLKDLSKGGARFTTVTSVGEIGETVEVFLPALVGPDIAVLSEIIWSHKSADGYTVAVRFNAVEPAKRQALIELIDVLLSTAGGGARVHPRVARRMEIRCGHLGELLAILEDISRGGLSMTVTDPLVLYEELDITVPDTIGQQLLILRGRVVNQRPIDPDKEEGQPGYRIGLEFVAMRPETQGCLGELLRFVMERVSAGSAPEV